MFPGTLHCALRDQQTPQQTGCFVHWGKNGITYEGSRRRLLALSWGCHTHLAPLINGGIEGGHSHKHEHMHMDRCPTRSLITVRRDAVSLPWTKVASCKVFVPCRSRPAAATGPAERRWSEQPDVTDAMQRMAVPGLPSDIALDRHYRASAQRCSLLCKLCGGHGGQPCWAADLSALRRWWWPALCMCSSPLRLLVSGSRGLEPTERCFGIGPLQCASRTHAQPVSLCSRRFTRTAQEVTSCKTGHPSGATG